MHATNQQLEALLIASDEPIRCKDLSRIFQCTDAEIAQYLDAYAGTLSERGFVLVRTETTVALAVHPQCNSLIEKFFGATQPHELGQAGMEILAIILYKKEATRAAIEYIRGVNSSFALRTLLMRGLVERVLSSEDAREYVYRPTVELLSHLGLTVTTELPDFSSVHALLTEIDQRSKENV